MLPSLAKGHMQWNKWGIPHLFFSLCSSTSQPALFPHPTGEKGDAEAAEQAPTISVFPKSSGRLLTAFTCWQKYYCPLCQRQWDTPEQQAANGGFAPVANRQKLKGNSWEGGRNSMMRGSEVQEERCWQMSSEINLIHSTVRRLHLFIMASSSSCQPLCFINRVNYFAVFNKLLADIMFWLLLICYKEAVATEITERSRYHRPSHDRVINGTALTFSS